jgi:hypothetical protein
MIEKSFSVVTLKAQGKKESLENFRTDVYKHYPTATVSKIIPCDSDDNFHFLASLIPKGE